jgi:hypothetical protein
MSHFFVPCPWSVQLSCPFLLSFLFYSPHSLPLSCLYYSPAPSLCPACFTLLPPPSVLPVLLSCPLPLICLYYTSAPLPLFCLYYPPPLSPSVLPVLQTQMKSVLRILIYVVRIRNKGTGTNLFCRLINTNKISVADPDL